jgi:HSP20 family protein
VETAGAAASFKAKKSQMIKKYAAYVDFERLQEELNQLLEELSRLGPDIATWSSGTWHPPVDIFETKEEVVVLIELPGVRRADTSVALKHNTLVISGKKYEDNSTENNACFLCLERSYGEFRRVVPLTRIVDPNNGRATLKDGILTIRLGKIVDSRKSEYHIRIKED